MKKQLLLMITGMLLMPFAIFSMQNNDNQLDLEHHANIVLSMNADEILACHEQVNKENNVPVVSQVGNGLLNYCKHAEEELEYVQEARKANTRSDKYKIYTLYNDMIKLSQSILFSTHNHKNYIEFKIREKGNSILLSSFQSIVGINENLIYAHSQACCRYHSVVSTEMIVQSALYKNFSYFYDAGTFLNFLNHYNHYKTTYRLFCSKLNLHFKYFIFH